MRLRLVMVSLLLVSFACKKGDRKGEEAQAPTEEKSAEVDKDAAVEKQEDVDIEQEARAFVEALSAGEFERARARFDAKMTEVMPPDRLAKLWRELIGKHGEFQDVLDTRTDRQAGYEIVFVGARLAGESLDIKVVFDRSAKIAGLFVVPRSQAYQAPAYADSGKFEEREVTVGGPEWALPGTLTVPRASGPHPAVVLVHGSGPNDRDESVGARKPFRDLAWGLASRGVAVLRYDKRTRVHAGKISSLQGFTAKEEAVDDALEAARLLRNEAGIDDAQVYVLGHSLGGMLVPRIGKRDPALAGLIVLAGTTRPLEEVMLEQVEYLTGGGERELTAEEKASMEAVRDGAKRVKALSDADANSGEPILAAPASYWLDLRGYDPPALAAELSHRMLILQGARDYQVTEKDFVRWKEALSSQPRVTFKNYPALDHLFGAGKGPSMPSDYERPENVDVAVIDDIAAWIRRSQ